MDNFVELHRNALVITTQLLAHLDDTQRQFVEGASPSSWSRSKGAGLTSAAWPARWRPFNDRPRVQTYAAPPGRGAAPAPPGVAPPGPEVEPVCTLIDKSKKRDMVLLHNLVNCSSRVAGLRDVGR